MIDPLDPHDRGAVEALVGSEVVSTEVVWERAHVVRVGLADGRSVITKRPRREGDALPTDEARASFAREHAVLALLAEVPDSPAPTLLGYDGSRDLLVMEDLPPGRALSDLLLATDADEAADGVVALGAALARLHAGTSGLEARFDAFRSDDGDRSQPRWAAQTDEGTPGLVAVTERFGASVDAHAVEDECRQVTAALRADGWWRTLVHGDPCPDNTRIEDGPDGRFRIFDYERSSFGSCLLDASYLLAPFPTCWCFARLPADVSARAVAAYRTALGQVVPEALDDGEWNDALAVALAAWVVGRGGVIAGLLDGDDRPWGTTGVRPRILQWIDAFVPVGEATGRFPALSAAAATLRPALAAAWPEAVVGEYPALPSAASLAVAPPEWWRPGL